MTDYPLIAIASKELTAEIHPLGAQLFSLRDQTGRDLQWNGDPAIWKGRAPILFPIVGALAGNHYRLDGKEHFLSRHGFARDSLFSLVTANAASALFRLNWDETTFALYPFRFQLDLQFSLAGATLHMVATIKNVEVEKVLPASFGFHPAFRWPLPYGAPRDEHFIKFEKQEPEPVRRLDSDGLLAPAEIMTPVKKDKLKLHDDLFAADVIIFDRLDSRRVIYGAERGPRLEFEYVGMPYLGVWTKPEANFICIEPWHGLADPQGFSADFRSKPGIALIPPAAEKKFSMSISLVN
ncbi:MAG: aldose 1-epimerase family protein [Rhizomicrobium sp.]